MNYLAYCAQGKDYTYLSDDLLDEMVNRTPLYEQPHFKRCPQRRDRRSATASGITRSEQRQVRSDTFQNAI